MAGKCLFWARGSLNINEAHGRLAAGASRGHGLATATVTWGGLGKGAGRKAPNSALSPAALGEGPDFYLPSPRSLFLWHRGTRSSSSGQVQSSWWQFWTLLGHDPDLCLRSSLPGVHIMVCVYSRHRRTTSQKKDLSKGLRGIREQSRQNSCLHGTLFEHQENSK